MGVGERWSRNSSSQHTHTHRGFEKKIENKRKSGKKKKKAGENTGFQLH